MKILVTGSTGFIGGALCRALAAQGHTVRAFHRPNSSLRLLEGLPLEHAIGDLTQPATLTAAMEGVEAVFHAAAWMGDSEPGRLYAVTVEGTRAVLQAARQAGVRRLVHTSSVAALGVPPPGSGSQSPRSFALRKAPVPLRFAKPPFLRGSLFWGQRVPILGTEGPDFKDPGEGEIILMDETHTWNIRPERYPYGYAKYLAELEVQKEVALGLDAVIVNPGLVLGPGDIHRGSSSILLQVAKRKLGVSMEGGLNVVHIQDVVTGHIKALEYGRTGERYILGGENLTHTEFLKILARVTGTPPNFIELPAALVRALRLPALFFEHFIDLPVSAELFTLAGCAMFCDTRKARNELGLPAPLSVEQAAAEAYAWFRGE